MTYDEAKRIIQVWGQHLETLHPKLMTVFFLGSIPDIFLPHPREVLLEATNVLGKFYFDMGDRETSELYKKAYGPAFMYTDDAEAAEHQLKIWTMAGLEPQKIMLDKLREYREGR